MAGLDRREEYFGTMSLSLLLLVGKTARRRFWMLDLSLRISLNGLHFFAVDRDRSPFRILLLQSFLLQFLILDYVTNILLFSMSLRSYISVSYIALNLHFRIYFEEMERENFGHNYIIQICIHVEISYL